MKKLNISLFSIAIIICIISQGGAQTATESLSASIDVRIRSDHMKLIGGSYPRDRINYGFTIDYPYGTSSASNEICRIYHAEIETATRPAMINLNTAPDVFGQVATWTMVESIFIENQHATASIIIYFCSATHIRIAPGGRYAHFGIDIALSYVAPTIIYPLIDFSFSDSATPQSLKIWAIGR
jgi:hypothetical protein